MTWCGWYSAKQEKLFGYAHYLNKKNKLVCITNVNQDPKFKHSYKDSVYQGELTHYCGVRQRNHTKKRGKEASHYMYSTIEYDKSASCFKPHKIIN